MATLRLTLACGDYDRTRPLKDGLVRPDGVELEVLFLSPEETFHRMGRFREFDVSEFSLSTYTILRSRGEDLVAIPVFPSRVFRHSSIYVRADAGIRTPGDLRGKRVGVPKYHMTAAVWIRGLLEDEYGVAPKDILWFEGGEGARVKEVDVELPAAVRRQPVPGDRTLGAMVEAGELDAFVGARVPAAFRSRSSRLRRLFPNYREVEQAYYRKTGIFPIMHTVVLREELVARHPWLPKSLYEAFQAAKRIAYERLDEAAALAYALPWLVAEAEETRALMGDDPFAYGIRLNRTLLETFLGYSVAQGLATRRLAIEEMFCAATLDT